MYSSGGWFGAGKHGSPPQPVRLLYFAALAEVSKTVAMVMLGCGCAAAWRKGIGEPYRGLALHLGDATRHGPMRNRDRP